MVVTFAHDISCVYVCPWNIFMMVLIYQTYFKVSSSQLQFNLSLQLCYYNFNNRIGGLNTSRTTLRNSNIFNCNLIRQNRFQLYHWLLLILMGIMPFLNKFGNGNAPYTLWPPYLSFVFYSANVPTAWAHFDFERVRISTSSGTSINSNYNKDDDNRAKDKILQTIYGNNDNDYDINYWSVWKTLHQNPGDWVITISICGWDQKALVIDSPPDMFVYESIFNQLCSRLEQFLLNTQAQGCNYIFEENMKLVGMRIEIVYCMYLTR